MSDNLTESEQQALHHDIGQLEALIDELLTYARLDHTSFPQSGTYRPTGLANNQNHGYPLDSSRA